MSVPYPEQAPLDVARIKAMLKTAYIGRNLVYYAAIGSTNDVARDLAQAQAAEGTLVIADVQSAGRGRLGRQWLSPPNSDLLMSLLFRPLLSPGQAQRLTMICSLAVVSAIREVAGLEAQIKWPNDLLLAGKKTGGILTELGLQGNALAYAIVGIGLNVNLRREQMPDLLLEIATSIAQVRGGAVAREPLLCAILEQIERRYDRLRAGETPAGEWAGRLATLGKWVCVTDPNESLEGWAEGVDAEGALFLRLADGRRRRILAGDVTLREGDAVMGRRGDGVMG